MMLRVRGMRAEEMARTDSHIDWSHECSRCHAKLGIGKDAQAFLELVNGKAEIVCDHCDPWAAISAD
jgi:DNA-directed RNA polymerase subunit RPC12/RpoP